jgi:hypothetical protein
MMERVISIAMKMPHARESHPMVVHIDGLTPVGMESAAKERRGAYPTVRG